MSDDNRRLLRLGPWDEVRGILNSLDDEDGLYATISTYTIAFPADLIHAIKPFLGKRMAILRTDLPQKTYLFRILDDEPNHAERDGVEGLNKHGK